MTVNQFVEYCEAYPHSSEAFTTLKECMEVDLMQSYLEGVKFSSTVLANESHFTEGYLIEDTDIDVTYLEAAVKTKRQGLLSKILKGMASLFRRFGSFIGRFISRDLSEGVADTWNGFVQTGIPDLAFKGIMTVGGTLASAYGIKLVKKHVAPKYKVIYDKLPKQLQDVFDVVIEAYPEVFQQNETKEIEIEKEPDNKVLMLDDIRKLHDRMNDISKSKNSEKAFKKLVESIDAAIKGASGKTAKIPVAKDKLSEMKDLLNKLGQSCLDLMRQAPQLNLVNISTTDLQKMLNELSVSISSTIRVYNAIDNLRKTVATVK